MLMRSLPDDANSAVIPQLSPVARGEPAAADARSREHLVKILFDRREILISVTDRPMQPAPHRQDSAAHFHVVNAALAEHLRELYDDTGSHEVLVVDPRVVREPAVERLVQAFVAFDGVERDLVALHVEALCLAILTRLLSMRGNSNLSATGRRMAPLPKWRLKRVVDYVNAHLASRITLADLAGAAGRTRMHFAAQFRVATGSRPHDFVLRRRIERAQQLLRDPSLALADIALGVGFQNQAHFTTVFKRFTGATPHRWRRSTQVSGFRDGSEVPAAARPSASAVEAVASCATAQASS
jgi:AraC-like DNA-binding protein